MGQLRDLVGAGADDKQPRTGADRLSRHDTYWADLLAWVAEDDPARYAAALRLSAVDFYHLVASKRKTIQKMTAASGAK